MQDSRGATGCWMIKISQKQADFTVFALNPKGARALPSQPPGYAGVQLTNVAVIIYLLIYVILSRHLYATVYKWMGKTCCGKSVVKHTEIE